MAITEKKETGLTGSILFTQPSLGVTLTLAPTSQQQDGKVTVRATFTTVVEDFSYVRLVWNTSDGSVGVGIPESITAIGSQQIWDIVIPLPQTVSGSLIVTVPSNSVTADSLDSNSVASIGPDEEVSFTFSFNNEAPFFTLTYPPTPIFSALSTITIRASEVFAGFTQSKITIATLNDSAMNTVDIHSFTETTQGEEWELVLSIPESRGHFQDSLSVIGVTAVNTGKTPLIPPIFPKAYDRAISVPVVTPAPIVEIIIPPEDQLPYKETKAEILFRWNESVSDFGDQVEDITITGATIGTLTVNDDNNVFTLPLTLADKMEGQVDITVSANSATSIESGETGPTTDVEASFKFDTTSVSDKTITGSTKNICSVSHTFANNPYLDAVLDGDAQGGAFLSGGDFAIRGSSAYFVIQIQRKREVGDRLATELESGSVLAKANIGGTGCEILKTYVNYTQGARSLKTINDEVYFFEGSAYSDIDGEEMGTWFKIESDDTIVSLGTNWQSEEGTDENVRQGVHTKTISPIVADNDNRIYMITGYGNLDNLLSETDNESQLIDNWQLLEYSDRLDRNIALLETNNRPMQRVLEELAILTFSVIGYVNDRYEFRSREIYNALTNNPIPTGSISTIAFQTPERDFPSSGKVFIGTELFSYTGVMGNNFTGVTRGLFDTSSSAAIPDSSKIKFVNHELDNESGLVEDVVNRLNIKLSPFLYNIIRLRYDGRTFNLKNDESIKEFGEKLYEKNLTLLTRHQTAWVTSLAGKFRDYFSNPRYRVTLRVKNTFHVELGQTVLFRDDESGFLDVLYIIDKRQLGLETQLVGETIT